MARTLRFAFLAALVGASKLEELEARLQSTIDRVSAVEAENRALRAKLAAAQADAGASMSYEEPAGGQHRRLQASSSRASITYDGTTVAVDAAMQIAGDVNVTGAVKPGKMFLFKAYLSAWTYYTTAAQNIVFDSNWALTQPNGFDRNDYGTGGFDTSTGIFTVPVNGIYLCHINVYGHMDSFNWMALQVDHDGDGTGDATMAYMIMTGIGEEATSSSGHMPLEAGWQLFMTGWSQSDTDYVFYTSSTYQSCMLLAETS